MAAVTWAEAHGLDSANGFSWSNNRFIAMLANRPIMEDSRLASSGNKHPNFLQLNLLVFAAVLEVVCVSLPGYITARMGMFDAESQKFLANLNVAIFTPCLIWTKLGSQLTPDKLGELAIIPLIFIVQTLVSYGSARGISKLFRFNKRQNNFVTAMGVFGNSNSLPISLILSLSKTLPGLHWKKILNDNDDEVAARGILYLLVFQQLGQMVRWSWGYHVLLAPPDAYSIQDGGTANASIEEGRHTNEPAHGSERRRLMVNVDDDSDLMSDSSEGSVTPNRNALGPTPWNASGTTTPLNQKRYASSSSTLGELHTHFRQPKKTATAPPVLNGQSTHDADAPLSPTDAEQSKGIWARFKAFPAAKYHAFWAGFASLKARSFNALPPRGQSFVTGVSTTVSKIFHTTMEFMNPPLYAMLCAIVIACVPKLRELFFTHGTFLNTSVTRAIDQSGGVAVPLILVVLGANLARNTIPTDQLNADDPKTERKLLIACLVSRLVLPLLIMGPMLAVLAKYAPVSIVDDPVFVVVCFLLTGAPSALQLAQICQLNNVYVTVMSKLLFLSYVVWILPSTLIQVVLAIEVVKWAAH